jgi:hypothetical protein
MKGAGVRPENGVRTGGRRPIWHCCHEPHENTLPLLSRARTWLLPRASDLMFLSPGMRIGSSWILCFFLESSSLISAACAAPWDVNPIKPSFPYED